MEIIPSVNCPDISCVRERFEQIVSFGASWAHVDVSNGTFAPPVTWNNPHELISNSKLNIEVHLMVQEPEKFVPDWVQAGARRIILQVEMIDRERLYEILEMVHADCEVGLSVSLPTPIEEVFPYLEEIHFVQCLAVSPGLSGQKFQHDTLDKIRVLLREDVDVLVEIDGGVTPDVARLAYEAGARVAVSSSYIFTSSDPKLAYARLSAIGE
ncbi:hypothetical protein A3A21_03430 [Candidatus Jorgensenbacteria bacterium RIFCSPLOWO2_01_FULL_45_25b]|uniref:Ribulose-phosphate 3-epimerase n=1 Tax=Candidatus Jorgensenbacteria bacterium RIFCSPLOWO2_01_FULL_45_25b TaxID=1798471 RepID=A0A1F6BZ45_9BACT|nr:MAG: hypothetical protein A3A21_03430 [Candidatus Jorgensenbacteria bacterium RIFCSPLOWO2_01_FULL_45_25b]